MLRVMIAVDSSPPAHHAFHYAIHSLLSPAKHELVILTAQRPPIHKPRPLSSASFSHLPASPSTISSSSTGSPSSSSQPSQPQPHHTHPHHLEDDRIPLLPDRVHARLRMFAAEAHKAGFVASPWAIAHKESGKKIRELVLVAAETLGVDVIVVGSRASSSFGRLFSGSMSTFLLRNFGGDVILVRPKRGPWPPPSQESQPDSPDDLAHSSDDRALAYVVAAFGGVEPEVGEHVEFYVDRSRGDSVDVADTSDWECGDLHGEGMGESLCVSAFAQQANVIIVAGPHEEGIGVAAPAAAPRLRKGYLGPVRQQSAYDADANAVSVLLCHSDPDILQGLREDDQTSIPVPSIVYLDCNGDIVCQDDSDNEPEAAPQGAPSQGDQLVFHRRPEPPHWKVAEYMASFAFVDAVIFHHAHLDARNFP